MKRTLSFFLFAALLAVIASGCAPAATPTPEPSPIPPTATVVPPSPTPAPQDALANFHWFGTSAILYTGSKVIYFDPITLDGNLPKADLILVTHAHSDHWSVPDLQKIIGANTSLIIGANVSVAYEADKAAVGIPATIMNDGDKNEIDGISIEAVPAYDGHGHPQGAGGVGFIVKIDGLTVYMAGGTAAYPEMVNYACDIAFIPVYTKAQAQDLADVIPAKTFVLEHTSYYAALAVADLFNESFAGKKIFVALQDGPNNQ
jgi:L-ascorbate metabolism protein UlaG (beta-lactamase superfamily)